MFMIVDYKQTWCIKNGTIRCLAVCFVFLFHMGCGKKLPTVSGLANVQPLSQLNPPVGLVDDTAGFYVRAVTDPNYSYLVHRDNPVAYIATSTSLVRHSVGWSYSVGAECRVDPADAKTSKADILCYIEADELDLFFNGVTLQHNLPSNMCSYLGVKLPWFYRYPVGAGPNVSYWTVNSATAAITDQVNAYHGVPFCPYDFSKNNITYSGPNYANPSPSPSPWPSPSPVVSTPVPPYDHAPNCCLGNYQQFVNTIGTSSLMTVSTGSWGGTVSSCIAGPGVDLQKADTQGFPMEDLFFVVGTGINSTYTIASPHSKGLTGNLYASNYFSSPNYDDPTTYPNSFRLSNNTSTPLVLPATTTYPIGFFPTSASQPQYLTIDANPFYQYTCYDHAMEVKARIRLLVRSWDAESSWSISPPSLPKIYQVNINACAVQGIASAIPSPPNPLNCQDLVHDSVHDFQVWDQYFPITPISGVFDSFSGYSTGFTNKPSKVDYWNFLIGYPLYSL